MCSKFDRQTYAKRIIQGKGRDVLAQRADRRQRLVENFKFLRIKKFDSFRNLKENELTYEVLCELKQQILSTLDNRELVQEEELTHFLEDLEEEMKIINQEQQNQQYEQACMEEIEIITNNLMKKCDICEDLIMQSGICEPCAREHFALQF